MRIIPTLCRPVPDVPDAQDYAGKIRQTQWCVVGLTLENTHLSALQGLFMKREKQTAPSPNDKNTVQLLLRLVRYGHSTTGSSFAT